jgi:hypothetical protein
MKADDACLSGVMVSFARSPEGSVELQLSALAMNDALQLSGWRCLLTGFETVEWQWDEN